MKVVLQSLGNGRTDVLDCPLPALASGTLLIANEASLISAGTERMLVEFGRSDWITKARQQPEKVRQVLDKLRTDGLLSTWESVRTKLDEPIPLGYSACGRVIGVGAGVEGFRVGDRVVSNGSHAEVVRVPKNLCAPVPAGISAEDACFTVVAAIGLQGVRLAKPTLGETFVVSGLGLIGLLTVQLLKAAGCHVIGADLVPDRLALAARWGVQVVDLSVAADPVAEVARLTGGRGADGVIVAAATSSSEPVRQAAAMCRKRGRVVVVGATGLDLARGDLYEKEVTVQVSCSYGPGRYDAAYEQGGQDYPLAYVRWTEQRNFEAVLALLASGRLEVASLVSKRYPIDDASSAYEDLVRDRRALGLVLCYPDAESFLRDEAPVRRRSVAPSSPSTSVARPREGRPTIAVIGAGNYSSRVLVPALAENPVNLRWVVSSGGVSAARVARKFGFARASTDPEEALLDPEVDAVLIATRHDSHAAYVRRALEAGKHVFVEKPLGISVSEVDEVSRCYETLAPQGGPVLMVGFNRRFAPLVEQLGEALVGVSGPRAIVVTVNAGLIPASHWTQHPTVGGGRIVGEACHFVDLAQHLAGSPIADASIRCAHQGDRVLADVAVLSIAFGNGSVASIQYLANGHRGYPKERVEVFAGGRVLRLDNFRNLQGWGVASRRFQWSQDKGHKACLRVFLGKIATGEGSQELTRQMLESSRWTARLGATAGAHSIETTGG